MRKTTIILLLFNTFVSYSTYQNISTLDYLDHPKDIACCGFCCFNNCSDLLSFYHRTLTEPSLKQIVQLMIDKKQNLNNIHQQNGNTPLIEAAASVNLEVIHILLENNADVNRQNYAGNNALMELYTCHSYQTEKYKKNKTILEITTLLIKKGINLKCVNKSQENVYEISKKNGWKS